MTVAVPRTERAEVEQAVDLLESQSFAVRIAEYAGRPFSHALGLVPMANGTLRRVVHSAIMRSLELAVDSLEEEAHPPSLWLPKAMTGLTGGIGGLFGLAALPFELPLTTTLMLRSIADIARHNGEDLSKMEARLACLEVFALGGRKSDAKDEIGYYAARAVFAKLSNDLVAYLMERSVLEVSAPVVTRIVSNVVSSFGMVVGERAAASAVPVLGAVGGATLNMIFMNHFERVARGHFALRRLERMHGQAEIGQLYAELRPPPRK
jgi:hypothetical protein